jgi:hypothetical protein
VNQITDHSATTYAAVRFPRLNSANPSRSLSSTGALALAGACSWLFPRSLIIRGKNKILLDTGGCVCSSTRKERFLLRSRFLLRLRNAK